MKFDFLFLCHFSIHFSKLCITLYSWLLSFHCLPFVIFSFLLTFFSFQEEMHLLSFNSQTTIYYFGSNIDEFSFLILKDLFFDKSQFLRNRDLAFFQFTQFYHIIGYIPFCLSFISVHRLISLRISYMYYFIDLKIFLPIFPSAYNQIAYDQFRKNCNFSKLKM